ncbi:MAG: hypothetical protein GXY89_00500 [Tissierellia bacterium]|nr:hypothetical protein [Tissierellia bacterium]
MDEKTILVFKDLTRKKPKEKRHYDINTLDDELRNLSKGDLISHIKFGDGIIIEIENGIIDVSFSGDVKKFPFPDAFLGGFLIL